MGHRVGKADVVEAKVRAKVKEHRDLMVNLAYVTPSKKGDATRAQRNVSSLMCSTPMTPIRNRELGAAPLPAIPVRAVSPVPVLTSP